MRDTAHLSDLEECYYSRMIDQYYIREKCLPLDIAQCWRLVRAVTAAARRAVESVLKEFFTKLADGWHQKRCDAEIAKAHERSSAARQSARISAEVRKVAAVVANAQRTHERTLSERSANQKPLTKSHEPLAKSQDPLAAEPTVPSLENQATSTALAPPPAKKPPKGEPPTGLVWAAYATAYFEVYKTEPVRNAMVNGQLAHFVSRIGQAEAPQVAASYLRSRNARYVAAGHSVAMLVQDAEKLRTEWANGNAMTSSEATRIDRGSESNPFLKMLKEGKNGAT